MKHKPIRQRTVLQNMTQQDKTWLSGKAEYRRSRQGRTYKNRAGKGRTGLGREG